MNMKSRRCWLRREGKTCVRRSAISQMVLLALPFAGTLLVSSGCAPSIEGSDGREVSLEDHFAALLEYPGVTSFPQHVPDVDTHREPALGVSWEIKPKEIYAASHRSGWKDCLLLLGSQGVEVETQEVAGAWFCLSGASGKYVFSGMKDGFDDCKRRIAVLWTEYGDEELRKLALRAFDEMSDPSLDYTSNGQRRSPGAVTREVRVSTGTD